MKKTTLVIKGMHCESCNALIEEVCLELPGVKRCSANFKEGVAAIEHEQALDAEKLREEIQSLGPYRVVEIQGDVHYDAR